MNTTNLSRKPRSRLTALITAGIFLFSFHMSPAPLAAQGPIIGPVTAPGEKPAVPAEETTPQEAPENSRTTASSDEDSPLSPPTEDTGTDTQVSGPEASQSAVSDTEDFNDGPLSPVAEESGNTVRTTSVEEDTNQEAALAVDESITLLPGSPILSTFAEQATVTVEQTSSSQFRTNFDISTPGSFGGSIINFGESPGGPQDLSGIQQFDFEMAASAACPAGTSCVKIEFVDSNNEISVVTVDSLTTDFTPVVITQQALLQSNANIDMTSIKQINFVLDEANSPAPTGFLDTRVRGLAFTPTVSGTTPPGTVAPLPGSPPVTTFAHESTVDVVQVLDGQYLVNYDLSTPDSFGGAIINYIETPAGSHDFSSASAFSFNLRTDNNCENSQCLKIEFQDLAGSTAVVNVTGLSTNFENVTITREQILEANPDIDLASIRQINFVLEERNLDPASGFLEIQTGELGTGPGPGPGPDPDPDPDPNPDPDPDPTPGTPIVVTAGASAGAATQFPGTPILSTFSHEGTINIEEVGGIDQFRINFDLTTPGSFGGGIINYGEAGGPVDLTDISDYVFNLSTTSACGTSPCAKIEFVDASGNLAVALIQGLDTTLKSVSLSRSALETAFPTVDFAQIKQINFVLEEVALNPDTGTLEVQTGGFGEEPGPGPGPDPDPDPDPTPDPDPVPAEGILTGITEGQTVSGTINIAPDTTDFPEGIKKTFYYLNGTKLDRQYEAPYQLMGPGGFDTTKLADGEYTLSGFVTTGDGVDERFSITFTVSNGNTTPPSSDPNEAAEGAITGLAEDDTVSGEVTVQPDLAVVPTTHKAFYYLDGTLLSREYDAPYAVTIDTTGLSDGPHTLSGLYTISEGATFFNSGDHHFSIDFTVNNSGGAPAPAAAPVTENIVADEIPDDTTGEITDGTPETTDGVIIEPVDEPGDTTGGATGNDTEEITEEETGPTTDGTAGDTTGTTEPGIS